MIKTFTLVAFMLVFPFLIYAQFEPEQRVIGGDASFSTSKNTAGHFTGFSINPSFAQFSKPNKLHGISISYAYNDQKLENSQQLDGTVSQSFGLNFFTQRFFPLTQNLFFTIRSNVGGSYQLVKHTGSVNLVPYTTRYHGYGVSLSVAPGISYKLSSRFLFDAYLSNLLLLAYNHSDDHSTMFNFSSSLSNTNLGSVGLGFRWLVKRK